jgi:ABC-2 type transport system ATP-binding protein
VEEQYIIESHHLKKYFKEKVALENINIKIHKGEFYGIFGKNGAGKSTLFKIILGLISSSEGVLKINDHLSIGYMPENIALYDHLSVHDNIQVTALSAGYDVSEEKMKDILEKVNLPSRTLAKNLSLGMKRRLQLAMATMCKPVDLLILDEPTNGMDVNSVLWLKDFLLQMKKKGITILVCSHSLNVLEQLIDHYYILVDGHIVKDEDWHNELHNQYILTINDDMNEKDISLIKNHFSIVKQEDDKLIIHSDKKLLDISRFIIENHLPVEDIDKEHESLEDIFLESVVEHD